MQDVSTNPRSLRGYERDFIGKRHYISQQRRRTNPAVYSLVYYAREELLKSQTYYILRVLMSREKIYRLIRVNLRFWLDQLPTYVDP